MSDLLKINLKDLTLDEMTRLVMELGKEQYTGRQLYKWIFRHGIEDFDQMSDIAKDFRELLAVTASINSLKSSKTVRSTDGTSKTVWDIGDGDYVESVLIPDEDRLTLCVSCQAGCPVGCPFCATGIGGFRRNLTSGEIYDQYLKTKKSLRQDLRITNIVFMGMGEPFLNYANVMKAVSALNDQLGAGIAAKRITISTVGYADGIKRLADDNPNLGLAISLHSAIDLKRRKLIPIAKKYPLSTLKEAVIYYAQKAADRVTFEYLLLKDINDSPADAKALVEFVQGIPCKINLITYNKVQNIAFKPPSQDKIVAFQEYLYPRAPVVTLRKSMGSDIAAACGQLAGRAAYLPK
jgi:23S rRNA (adenine2503-C2)-methyltransferase